MCTGKSCRQCWRDAIIENKLMKPTLTLLISLLLAPLAALHAAEPPETFRNPLPMPDNPIGRSARKVTNGEPDAREGWLLGHREKLCELADPVYSISVG